MADNILDYVVDHEMFGMDKDDFGAHLATNTTSRPWTIRGRPRRLSVDSAAAAMEASGTPGSQDSNSPMFSKSMSMGRTPPGYQKDVWRSVWNPGSNPNMKAAGSSVYDNAPPGSPTPYDWLYKGGSP